MADQVEIYENINFNVPHTHLSNTEGGLIEAADLSAAEVNLVQDLYGNGYTEAADFDIFLKAADSETVTGAWAFTNAAGLGSDIFKSISATAGRFLAGTSTGLSGLGTDLTLSGTRLSLKYWYNAIKEVELYYDSGDVTKFYIDFPGSSVTTFLINSVATVLIDNAGAATLKLGLGGTGAYDLSAVITKVTDATLKWEYNGSTYSTLVFDISGSKTRFVWDLDSFAAGDGAFTINNVSALLIDTSTVATFTLGVIGSQDAWSFAFGSLNTLAVYDAGVNIWYMDTSATTVTWTGANTATTLALAGTFVTLSSSTLTAITFSNASATLRVGSTSSYDVRLIGNASYTYLSFYNAGTESTRFKLSGTDFGIYKQGSVDSFYLDSYTYVYFNTATIDVVFGKGTGGYNIYMDINATSASYLHYRYNATNCLSATWTTSGMTYAYTGGGTGYFDFEDFTAVRVTDDTAYLWIGSSDSGKFSMRFYALDTTLASIHWVLGGTIGARINLTSSTQLTLQGGTATTFTIAGFTITEIQDPVRFGITSASYWNITNTGSDTVASIVIAAVTTAQFTMSVGDSDTDALHLTAAGSVKQLIIDGTFDSIVLPMVSAPATATEGALYYDSDTNKLVFYNGTGYETVTSA